MQKLKVNGPVAFLQSGRLLYEGEITAVYKDYVVCTFPDGRFSELKPEASQRDQIQPVYMINSFGTFFLITTGVREQLELQRRQLEAAAEIDKLARNVKRPQARSLESISTFSKELNDEIESNQATV